VVANKALLVERAKTLGLNVKLFDYNQADEMTSDGLYVLDVSLSEPVVIGQPSITNAAYIIECLRLAASGCRNGQFSGLVTGPINKGNINQAGMAFSGHTEWLANFCNVDKPVMVLQNKKMRIALLTTHSALKDVCAQVTFDNIIETVSIIHNDFNEYFKTKNPRIAVCGLNPHAGDDGSFGREEIDIIAPAVEQLRTNNINVFGPISADTAFTQDNLQNCDVVLAMYHDQGLPVIKSHGFHDTVNVTLGLPFVRTSVDHGTAYELAGSLDAKPMSLICAINTAIRLVKRKSHATQTA